jgi:hypothetical protein
MSLHKVKVFIEILDFSKSKIGPMIFENLNLRSNKLPDQQLILKNPIPSDLKFIQKHIFSGGHTELPCVTLYTIHAFFLLDRDSFKIVYNLLNILKSF